MCVSVCCVYDYVCTWCVYVYYVYGMYVCMCVFVYVGTVCVYVYKCVCVYVYVCMCMCVCVWLCECVYAEVKMGFCLERGLTSLRETLEGFFDPTAGVCVCLKKVWSEVSVFFFWWVWGGKGSGRGVCVWVCVRVCVWVVVCV